jgi:hypothetical protein
MGNVSIMRRTNRNMTRAAQGGLAALALVILTVSSIAAVFLVPASSHSRATRPVAAGRPTLPAANDMSKTQWAPFPFPGTAATMTPDATPS